MAASVFYTRSRYTLRQHPLNTILEIVTDLKNQLTSGKPAIMIKHSKSVKSFAHFVFIIPQVCCLEMNVCFCKQVS